MERERLVMKYKWTHIQSGKSGTNQRTVYSIREGLDLISRWNNNDHPEFRWLYTEPKFVVEPARYRGEPV